MYHAMTFVGRKDPALGSEQRVLVESHLFDVTLQLYGEQLTVHFERFLRPPIPVGSLQQLQQMLSQDERDCRKVLSELDSDLSNDTPTA
jgi:FAD synthase